MSGLERIAEVLEGSPSTDTRPRKRVRRIFDECVGSDLTSWEKNEFLPSIANRFVLTERQERTLEEIERRVFGGTHGTSE